MDAASAARNKIPRIFPAWVFLNDYWEASRKGKYAEAVKMLY
jgi:hypothetical protein